MKKFKFTKIKEHRESAGLTQSALATKIGATTQQVSLWENTSADRSLTTAYLAKIADALGKRPDDFFVEE
jgi:DNA-binding XRE family transcriptional regulator